MSSDGTHMSHVFPSLAQIRVLSRYTLGDIELVYRHDEATGKVEWSLCPVPLTSKRVARRGNMDDDFQVRRLAWRHAPWMLEPIAQVKLLGSANPSGLIAGATLRNAPDTVQLALKDHRVEKAGDRTDIVTLMQAKDGRYACEHRVWWHEGDLGIRVATTFINLSDGPLSLEMLSSFTLGDLTPFDAGEAFNRLRLHRYRSWWSAEARLDSQSFESLHLERVWGDPPHVERFGSVGSLPVRQFFPFVAVEDHIAGAVWAAQLAWSGSWQMELSRSGDSVALSGGLADRLSGHWIKQVPAGGRFTSPEALLTTVAGDVHQASQRLTQLHGRARRAQPAIEQSLPIAFNEWCTYWGDCTHDAVVALADQLKGTGVTYLVIDAGWYVDPGKSLNSLHGDWQVSSKRFPHGLKATADAIRARGLIPGLWFEFETCGEFSESYQRPELLLKHDGALVTSGTRRFFDFRKPEVVDLVAHRVIDLLRDCGFGYMKVDYNESIGLGVDAADSSGEGLRAHVEGVLGFFRRVRRELPDLVVENCSSGGHRLEPALMQLCAVGSFSDAHEGPEVPVIAAGLQGVIRADQNLVWAVLRADDSADRLYYSLAASFYGRLCISGDLTRLNAAQKQILAEAVALHPRIASIIIDGVSTPYFEHRSASWRQLKGWQAVARVRADQHAVLVVVHRFEEAGRDPKRIALPPGPWTITAAFGRDVVAATIEGDTLVYRSEVDWTAGVFLVER